MILTKMEIKQKCIVWAKAIWGLEFDIPVEVSGRMTTTLGYYRYRRISGKIVPVKLQFAKVLVSGDYKIDTVDSVILHELCHWALSQLNKPFSDGHPVFEKELKRIGASSTRTISRSGTFYEVKCKCCHDTVANAKTLRMANKYVNGGYRSRCCSAELVLGGEVKKEDTYVRQEAQCQEIEQTIKQLQNEITPIPSPQPTTLKIEDIFNVNERMTNAKMEALLKDLIISGEAEKIKLLRDHYEVTFNRALRYLGSRRNEQIKKLVG